MKRSGDLQSASATLVKTRRRLVCSTADRPRNEWTIHAQEKIVPRAYATYFGSCASTQTAFAFPVPEPLAGTTSTPTRSRVYAETSAFAPAAAGDSPTFLRPSVASSAFRSSFIRTVVLSNEPMPFKPHRFSMAWSSSQPEVGVVSMRSPCKCIVTCQQEVAVGGFGGQGWKSSP